ncbi:g7776 [Coccomyxa elongata]
MSSVPHYNPGSSGGGSNNGFISTDLLVAGNVTASKKLNVGTNLTVVGNETLGGSLTSTTISATSVSATGAVSGGSLSTSGTISGGSLTTSGTVSGGSLTTSGAVNGGSLTTFGNANVGAILTVATVNATNAITANHPVVSNPISISVSNLPLVNFIKNGFVSVPLSGALGTQFQTGPYSFVNYINPGNSRFQPPVAGLWYFNYTQQANFGTNAHISAQLQANSTDGSTNLFGASTFCSRSSATVQFPVSVSGVALCNGTSDYINVGIYAYTDNASASGFTYASGGVFQAILLQKTS